MPKSKIAILAVVVAALGMIVFILIHNSTVFAADGYISDSMCGRKHIMPGMDDSDCTQACVNAGAKYVLVSESKIYTLDGDLNSVKPFAGKQVHITGKANGSSITIATISAP